MCLLHKNWVAVKPLVFSKCFCCVNLFCFSVLKKSYKKQSLAGFEGSFSFFNLYTQIRVQLTRLNQTGTAKSEPKLQFCFMSSITVSCLLDWVLCVCVFTSNTQMQTTNIVREKQPNLSLAQIRSFTQQNSSNPLSPSITDHKIIKQVF